jgi:hypothetical protein
MLSVLFERGTRLDVKRISQAGADAAHLELWNRVLVDYVQPPADLLGALALELASFLPPEQLADFEIQLQRLVAQRAHAAHFAGRAQGGQPTST